MPAFIFDIDDTLYDRLTPFRLAYEEQYGACRDENEMRVLFHAFIRRGNQVFEDAMAGQISMEEMYIFRFRQAAADFGQTVSRQEALDFQTAYQWQQNHIQLSPALEKLLALCREQGAFLGVITNGPSLHQRDKCRALGLSRWIGEEHILASGDIGINKPDPGIFREAMLRWQLDPETTWYAGDSYDRDIRGAAGAGWHTIWLDRSGKNEQKKPPADFRVNSEEELCACIASLLEECP